MNPKNQNPTKEYNKRQTNEKKKKIAQESIFKALSDGQWHQNVELLSTTKLSSPTLHKHLKTMTKNQLIEKKTDIINGKHAVLFKAETYLLSYIEGKKAREYFSDNVDAILEETKITP
jgi:DNA-binding IclR family transcriptional regulator